jgi:hypothetical protein
VQARLQIHGQQGDKFREDVAGFSDFWKVIAAIVLTSIIVVRD